MRTLIKFLLVVTLVTGAYSPAASSLLGKARAASDLEISDSETYDICTAGNAMTHSFRIKNNTGSNIIIHACEFQNDEFGPVANLPVTLSANQTKTLFASFAPNSTGLCETELTLDYELNFEFKSMQANVQHGVFMSDDDPELLYTAAQAIEAFKQSRQRDSGSLATRNNRGVLLRLLGKTTEADDIFYGLIDESMNQRYGYSGIKMNLGVTRSDQGKYVDSHIFFSAALVDILDTKDTSALAPQIFFNEAWDAYQNDNFIEADQYLERVITHQKTNDYLLAKAFVLWGALYFRNGNSEDAIDAFNEAIDLDPYGPIGKMARDNLEQFVDVDAPDEPELPENFALLPNYPNPFNPSTHILFELPAAEHVQVAIYNIVGQNIRTLLDDFMNAGRHELEWNGRDESEKMVESGIYIIRVKAGNLNASRKITLLK